MKLAGFNLLAGVALCMASLTSCGGSKDIVFLDIATPQETSFAPTKITDETQTSVIGNTYVDLPLYPSRSGYGIARDKKFGWDTGRKIAISPDGKEIAYLSKIDGLSTIMVKRASAGGPSTQRSFRKAVSLCWGNDGRIYYSDNTVGSQMIGSIDAHVGRLVKQHTNNNNDWEPVVSSDGEIMYFTRYSNSGPSIWSYNLKTGELTNCTRGFNPVILEKNKDEILISRNSANSNTEIWLINLKNGTETVILSDSQKGFTDPVVSPDGKWILVVGNSLSTISQKENTDIYAVRIDGSEFTQLTYHPAVDCCPAWSPDGRFIYFISSRANKDNKFNIWRIINPLQ